MGPKKPTGKAAVGGKGRGKGAAPAAKPKATPAPPKPPPEPPKPPPTSPPPEPAAAPIEPTPPEAPVAGTMSPLRPAVSSTHGPESEARKMFDQLAAKKMVEWDRMVDAKAVEERAQSLDRFRTLSREEVDLAEKAFTKTLDASAPTAARALGDRTMMDFAGLTKGDGKIQFDKFPVGGGASRLAKSMGPRFSASVLDVTATIDQKVKLLSQLESARCVLQNHPGGSTTSMDDEVRSRLRKINRAQMQVIDEILGSKADLTSDFVSELQPDRHDRKRFGLGKADKLKGSRRVIVQLPGSDHNGTRDVTISLPGVEDDISSEGAVCLGNTDLCPKPSRERLGLRRASVGRLPLERRYSPPPHFHYEHHLELYGGNVPHYHEEEPAPPPPPPPPPQDAYYPPAAGPSSNYCTVHSECVMHSPLFHPNCGVMTQGGFGPSVSHVGVGGEGTFPDGIDEENPNVVSRTVIVLNRAPDAENPGLFQPVVQPARQQVAVQAGGGAGRQLTRAVLTPATLPVTVAPSTMRSKSAASTVSNAAADQRFAKSCRDSLRKIADSMDDVIASLSTSDRQPNVRRRRRRYADDDYNDVSSYDENDDSDYEDPPRRHRRSRSRTGARRRPSVEDRQGTSFWSWLCRGLRSVRDKSPCSRSKRDEQLIEVSDRIRELVQKVVEASNEVINARNAIQQGGVQGQMAIQSVLSTEKKLWDLIAIERDLANELAEYKALDSSSDSAYVESLNQAEEKIKRLIEVETQLATEIETWRQMYQQTPYKRGYAPTTGYGAPAGSSSSEPSLPRRAAYAPSSTSLGYLS